MNDFKVHVDHATLVDEVMNTIEVMDRCVVDRPVINIANIPKPWADLKKESMETQAAFIPADAVEIKGILETHEAAIEMLASDVPEGTDILDTMTIRSFKATGAAKSRVVICGNQMDEGKHFARSYNPTMQHVTLRMLCAIQARRTGSSRRKKCAKARCGDFGQAFLNALLPTLEYLYVWPPKSARQYDEQGRRLVWKVVKALYGAKSSGRHWYYHLRDWLLTHEFEQSMADPCVFIRTRAGEDPYIFAFYVDDVVHLTGNTRGGNGDFCFQHLRKIDYATS